MKNLKLRHQNDITLESHPYFSYFAWALILLSSLFVIKLTLDLKTTVEDLQQKTQNLETTIMNKQTNNTKKPNRNNPLNNKNNFG